MAGHEGLSLVGKAAELFMGSVLNDARLMVQQKHRQTQKLLGMNTSSGTVLSTADIIGALADAGVHLKT